MFKSFERIMTFVKEGKTIALVAISEPKIPAVLNPAKVAILSPIGPGVTDDTPNIIINSFEVNQSYFCVK